MNSELSTDAEQFGAVVAEALQRLGGIALAEQAHGDPGRRAAVADALGGLGTWDLDPRAGDDELQAAALACRAAGRMALPYPVAERLSRHRREEDALTVVDGDRAQVHMADLPLRWAVTDGRGRRASVTRVEPPLASRAARFVCQVETAEWEPGGDASLFLTLQAWTILGLVEEAARRTYAYVQDRRQFGAPLGDLQSVQFRLTDVSVAVQGLERLALYTLWSVGTSRPGAPADALALRLQALEAADVVMRSAHQLHGAIGFCDETELSWLSLASLPLRRLPWGRTGTEARLLELLDDRPLDGLFSDPGGSR